MSGVLLNAFDQTMCTPADEFTAFPAVIDALAVTAATKGTFDWLPEGGQDWTSVFIGARHYAVRLPFDDVIQAMVDARGGAEIR